VVARSVFHPLRWFHGSVLHPLRRFDGSVFPSIILNTHGRFHKPPCSTFAHNASAANIPWVTMTTNSSLSVLNVCTQRHAANIGCIALAGAIPEPRRADARRSS
jgi:hypothetical protein